jgi:hypothetical protein
MFEISHMVIKNQNVKTHVPLFFSCYNKMLWTILDKLHVGMLATSSIMTFYTSEVNNVSTT